MTEQIFFLLFMLISNFIGLIYAGFIVWLILVLKIKKSKQKQTNFAPSISLIIIFRNEENNLLNLLESILNQNYPKSKMEIILVDDSSIDKGLELVRNFQKQNPELKLKLLELAKEKQNAFGKKEALTVAYSKAEGEIILLADADCSFGINNIKSRVSLFQNPTIKMVSANVLYTKNKNIFAQAQALENLSLMATTAATTAANLPILSNGANLAFNRQAYLSLPINALVKEEHSGDDLFLMHSFKKHFGAKSIGFEFDLDSVVFTQAQTSFKGFINQRIRWVSKSKAYKDIWIIFISVIVLSMNLSLIIAAVGIVFYKSYLILFGYLFGLKFLVDFVLLYIFAKHYKQNYLLWIYPFVQLIYPLFIAFSGILGQFLSYDWKGRKY